MKITTPMDILEKAYALEAEGYDPTLIPYFHLVGVGWQENPRLRASVRALGRAGLLGPSGQPGFWRLL